MNTFVRTTTVVAALTLGLAGCTSTPATPTPTGSGSLSPSGTDSSTGSTSGTPSDSAITSATTSTTATPTTSASPTVPPFTNDAGKKFSTLTQTGGAVVAFNGVKANVLVHPDSVTKGTVADLGSGAKVARGQVPYFVTVTYTNAGTTTLQFPSFGTYLRPTGNNADQPTPFTTDKAIPKCVSPDPPETFKPGSTFTDCQVFTFSSGATVGQLAYRPGSLASEITWKVA